MRLLTTGQMAALNELASDLGIPPLWLAALIDCESGWNPKALNSIGAAGLNQIIPSTASHLGVPSGSALIAAYPTIEAQLRGPTRSYLMALRPFSSIEDLALSNFAPAYRKAPQTPLTGLAAKYNPKYRTYGEYATVVRERAAKLSKLFGMNALVVKHPVASGTLALGALLLALIAYKEL